MWHLHGLCLGLVRRRLDARRATLPLIRPASLLTRPTSTQRRHTRSYCGQYMQCMHTRHGSRTSACPLRGGSAGSIVTQYHRWRCAGELNQLHVPSQWPCCDLGHDVHRPTPGNGVISCLIGFSSVEAETPSKFGQRIIKMCCSPRCMCTSTSVLQPQQPVPRLRWYGHHWCSTSAGTVP